jgi:hypothetical protein
MVKWIFILRLLGQDIETGEIDWHEAARVENLSFQICIENVVETTATLSDAGIQHQVFCKEMPSETSDNEEDDK